MSEPEIDRRCSVCGAAVRSRASFCPQCGQSTSPPAEKKSDSKKEPPKVAPVGSAEVAPTIDLSRRQVPDPSETQPLIAKPAKEVAAVPAQHHGLHKATDVAREQVEKIRKASSVVIDQAAYDPSLRFVLVGAVLFIVFLFLLLLSRVLG